MTGQLQSIQWTAMYVATIVTGVVGGALSQWGMQQTGFLIAGVFCGVGFLAVCLLVREPPRPTTAKASATAWPPRATSNRLWTSISETPAVNAKLPSIWNGGCASNRFG
jgi:hypothetical protein